jgi:zinc protease
MKTRTQITPASIPHAGNITQFTLRNGVRVFVYENFSSPSVVVQGFFQAGSSDEPREKAGLAMFTADCLTRGTRRFSHAEIFERTENISATFDISASVLTASFFVKSLVEDTPQMFDLLGHVLREPTFPAHELEKERAEWLTALQESAISTRAQTNQAFYELCYPAAHPFHYANTGYTETLKAITQDDVTGFHKRFFSARGMHIVIVGAIKAAKARRLCEATFGDWHTDRPARTLALDAPAPQRVLRRHIPIAGKQQTNLMLGFPGPSHNEADWTACLLMNSILGQFGMYGRLGESVRKQNGLVYAIGTRFDGGLVPGPWVLTAGTNPKTVDRVVAISRDEMRRIQDRPVSARELDDNKRLFIGSLPLLMETNEGIGGQIVSLLRYQRDLNWLLTYNDRVNAVTIADIRRAARRWLNPDAYVLTTSGP